MKEVALATALALALPSAAVAGTITTFSDLAAFTAAVGPTVVEDFGTTSAFPITTGVLNSATSLATAFGGPINAGDIVDGVTFSTEIGTGFFFNIDAGGGFTGGFLDRLSSGGVAPLDITFDVAQGAFGFLANSLMNLFDVTIRFSGGGSDVLTGGALSTNPWFFGYASDRQDIVGVSILARGGRFAFAIDDFRFTTQPGTLSPVPLPAGGVLLLAALGGLAAARRRRA